MKAIAWGASTLYRHVHYNSDEGVTVATGIESNVFEEGGLSVITYSVHAGGACLAGGLPLSDALAMADGLRVAAETEAAAAAAEAAAAEIAGAVQS